jgi:hypothetical protein
MLLLSPFALMAEQPDDSHLRNIHISEETKQMIFYRALQMDGCLSRMKYHLMYDEIDQEMRDRLIQEIDYIWYQLGINPLKNDYTK